MELRIQSRPFSKHAFEEVVREACDLKQPQPPPQVAYLISYLRHEEMGARSMLVEHPYVDRHGCDQSPGHATTS